MEYGADAKTASIVDQWLLGDNVMVTPVMTSSDGQTTDTQRSV